MKKVILSVSMFLFVVAANAQENKTAPAVTPALGYAPTGAATGAVGGAVNPASIKLNTPFKTPNNLRAIELICC